MKRPLDRPSGYFEFTDGNGLKVEGETRSCVHCQFTWIYNPKESFDRKLAGHPGITRGTCLRCGGLTCARKSCSALGCRSIWYAVEETEKSESGFLVI